MATRAEQLAELETELAAVKAQLSAMITGGQSFSVGQDLSVTVINHDQLLKLRTSLEKSIQRLKNGGRGFVVDMSVTPSNTDDPFRSGSEVLL